MTRKEIVDKKVKNIGPAICDVCESLRAECIQFDAGMLGFVKGTICDSCLGLALQKCSKEVGGDAKK